MAILMQVRFSLAQSAKVRVEVYNGAGKKVAFYRIEEMSPGIHTVSIKTQLPSGMYACKLETSAGMYVKQVALVK